MPGVITRRLFPILQLTRMALVFTAISNSLCTLLISVRARYGPSDVLERLPWEWAVAVVLISTGLYGFGMSLNDIIDRRRDQQLAGRQPQSQVAQQRPVGQAVGHPHQYVERGRGHARPPMVG